MHAKHMLRDIFCAGPWGVPLLGVIPYIMRHGGPEYFSACTRKYGGVYKVRGIKSWTILLVSRLPS